MLEAMEHSLCRKPNPQHKEDTCHGPKLENIALSGLPHVEVIADGETVDKNQPCNRPVILGGAGPPLMAHCYVSIYKKSGED